MIGKNDIENNINSKTTDLIGIKMAKKYVAVKSYTRKVGTKKIKVRAHLRKK